MRKALVCGAGGFIGGYLVHKLKCDGYWVRGVDVKHPVWNTGGYADDLKVLDLRNRGECVKALCCAGSGFDEVYQLAADMGGMGFIHYAECDILHNSALININMIDAATRMGIPRYFFSSSVCVYRDMQPGEPMLCEEDVIPANPDNEYGWEKLYAERVVQAYGRSYNIDVRIARFENCYGPLCAWRGGREKAPAALCRKVAEAEDGSEIEVWGDGTAIRSFVYVTDLVDGVCKLMQSDECRPTNIGTHEGVTIDRLAQLCIDVSGKNLAIRHVGGPVGVKSRNFSHRRIADLGWKPRVSLRDGIAYTYHWVKEQVDAQSLCDHV